MATATASPAQQELTIEQKLQKLTELYADAPEVGKAALKNGLAMITKEISSPSAAQKTTTARSMHGTGRTHGRCTQSADWQH